MRNTELSKTHDTFLSFASVRCDSCLMPDIWHVMLVQYSFIWVAM